MGNEKFPVLHQVTVEFIGNRRPLVYDFGTEDEAQQCLETLKQNPDAWHVFHSVQRSYRGKRFIQVSLYRSDETKQWQCSYGDMRYARE